MFEEILEKIAENPAMASVIIAVSAVLLFVVCIKPLVLWLVKKTKTAKDDKIADAMYKAIEEHQEEVEAIHKVAKKASAKKCK